MHGSITLRLSCVPQIIFHCSLKLVGKVHLCAKTWCSKKAAVRSPCIPTPVFSPGFFSCITNSMVLVLENFQSVPVRHKTT